MNDLRLELRARNNPLWHAIFDTPGQSVASFCAAHRLGQSQIGAYLNLKHSPWLKSGELTKQANDVCVALGAVPDDLFPQHLYSGLFPTQMAASVDPAHYVALSAARRVALPASQEYDLAAEDAKTAVGAILRTLRPREAAVLRMRFGLEGDRDHTLEEIAQATNLSKERVRQIEHKAIQKMRHPTRSRALRPYMEALA